MRRDLLVGLALMLAGCKEGGCGAGRSSAPSTPSVVASPAPSPPPLASVAAIVDAGPPAASGVRGATLPEPATLVGVRGEQALLRFGDKRRAGDVPFHANNGFRFQWFDLESMSLVAGSEWDEKEWEALAFAPAGSLDEKLASPALAADVMRHARAVASLREPVEDKIVAGKTFAFAELAGRLVRVPLDRDAGTVRLPPGIPGATFAAIAANDSASLYFLPEHNDWSLVSGDGKPMMKTGIAAARPVFSPDGAYAYVRGGPDKRCLERIATKTAEQKELACLPQGLAAEALLVSPSAKVVVLVGRTEPERTFVVLDLPAGQLRGTFKRPTPLFSAGAVTDDGVVVARSDLKGTNRLNLIDAKARSSRVAAMANDTYVPDAFSSAAWITTTRFAMTSDRRISVYDLTAITWENEPL